MKILYLTASPTYVVLDEPNAEGVDEKDYPKLDLWPELREVTDALFEARLEGFADLEIVPEARSEDISRYLDRRGANILHFSGHGDRIGTQDEEGNEQANLILHGDYGSGEYVSNEWLEKQIAKHEIEVVVLNCCWSEQIAQSLKDSVALVIGTTVPLRSDLAADFSRAFYQAIQRGLPLSDVLEEVKKVVGEDLYVFLNRDEVILSEVMLPTLKEEEQDTAAQEVLSLQGRLQNARARIWDHFWFDLTLIVLAIAVAFGGYMILNGLDCDKCQNLKEQVAKTPDCERDKCFGEVCKQPEKCSHACTDCKSWTFGQYITLAHIDDFLSRLVAKAEWLKFEPYAVMMMIAAVPMGRLVAGIFIFFACRVGNEALPLVGARTQERIQLDLKQGRIGKISEWLEEFES